MKKVLSYLIILFTLVTHIAAQDLRIVYIGNSITKGALLKDPTTEAPPVQASRYIEQQTNKKVIFRNCGVSGMTTLNFLPISNQQFPNILKATDELKHDKGKLIFSISLGTNDSACNTAMGAPVLPESYYTNMKAIIDELLNIYPESTVIIQCPLWYSPNTYNSAMYLHAGLERLKSYYPMIEKLVEHYQSVRPQQVYLGDTQAFDFFKKHHMKYFTPEKGNAGIFYLHPNKEGAKILGRFWAEAIMKAL